MKKLTVLITFLVLSACNQSKSPKFITAPRPDNSLEQPTPTPPTPPPPGTDPQLGLCSKLDLVGVRWPQELSTPEWTYYALSLNITGSFEGREGWKNITGNFDGQGLSLGLMQQNLGQGTLQPLLIEMYKQNNATLISLFSNRDYSNLKSMLETWQNRKIEVSQFSELSTQDNDPLFPAEGPLNQLDIGYEESVESQSNSANRKSVDWARTNILDSSGKVLSSWKTPFQSMASSPAYRSLQLMASTRIFNRAKQYMQFFKYRELRFLLFFFDIVVQNGSIGENHLARYNQWLKSNPNANDQEKALALLEARLTTVRPQYVADVRARKTAIIMGRGVVHQKSRNFPVEYCFDPNILIQ